MINVNELIRINNQRQADNLKESLLNGVDKFTPCVIENCKCILLINHILGDIFKVKLYDYDLNLLESIDMKKEQVAQLVTDVAKIVDEYEKPYYEYIDKIIDEYSEFSIRESKLITPHDTLTRDIMNVFEYITDNHTMSIEELTKNVGMIFGKDMPFTYTIFLVDICNPTTVNYICKQVENFRNTYK